MAETDHHGFMDGHHTHLDDSYDDWLGDGDDDGSGFCECGVTLDYGETECAVCAAAPHHRECPCDECDAYWSAIEARGRDALTGGRGAAASKTDAKSEPGGTP